MTRVVLDTNVLVSGLGWFGPPAAIVDAITAGELTLLSSPALMAELRRVLRYPKLAKVFADPDAIAELVASASVQVDTSTQLQVVGDDSDNRVLEAALDGGADCIVSGDGDLLSLGSFQGIPIVTPAAFLAAGTQ
ncbi:MAG TPA: putative toxin-antitoxin system toxin component, PIN family [Solirubrobacteraceae bacterium]